MVGTPLPDTASTKVQMLKCDSLRALRQGKARDAILPSLFFPDYLAASGYGAGRHARSSNAQPLLPHFRIVARRIPNKRPEGILVQRRLKTVLAGQVKILAVVDLD